MNCKNCGAPMSTVEGQNYLYCDYCASFYFPEKSDDHVVVLGESSGFNCPVCKTGLITGSIEDHRILYCPACHGVLANQQAFASLVTFLRANADTPAVQPKPLDPKALQRLLHCPACAKKMDTHPYGGPGNVVIDICTKCQLIFLDQGEIHKITSAPGRDRARPI